MSDDLEPMPPEEAVEMWLDRQRSMRAESSVQSYSYRLKPFIEWCDTQGIYNLNGLTSRDVFQYEAARRGEGLAVSTLNNQIGTLKRFLAFCVRIDAVGESLPAKIEVPDSEDFREKVNETKLEASRADEILDELSQFEYASRKHAIFALMWHTGCRLGGLRSLDLADIYFDEEDIERLRHRDDVDEEVLEVVELPFVFFQHRPDAEVSTPLKNKWEGSRPVALDEEIGQVLRDYIDIKRVDASEPDGRRPLFTTKGDSARISKSNIRLEIYIATQPCRYGGCPHDRDPADCKATEHGYESRCPSSRSTHPIRTGRITHLRDEGWPPEVVGERVDATPETIRLHYDMPDKIRRMQTRRKYLNMEADS